MKNVPNEQEQKSMSVDLAIWTSTGDPYFIADEIRRLCVPTRKPFRLKIISHTIKVPVGTKLLLKPENNF